MTRANKIVQEQQEGLIFIADISGFTKFVHETDIRLGKEILSELLSIILLTNDLNLEVSEIEGDAVLFYTYAKPPSLTELIRQYEFMLIAFKKKLRDLNSRRKMPDTDLSLKLIAHFGCITEYKLHGFKKLYGRTLVEAHQLLKNDIPGHSYILVTKDLLDRIDGCRIDDIALPQWIKRKVTIASAVGNESISFTYFLYDTEILKANVLRSDNNG